MLCILPVPSKLPLGLSQASARAAGMFCRLAATGLISPISHTSLLFTTTKISQSSSPNTSISPPSPTQFECVEESGPVGLKPAGAGVSASALEELGGAEVEVCCE